MNLISFLLALLLAACGGSDHKKKPSDDADDSSPNFSEDENENADDEGEGDENLESEGEGEDDGDETSGANNALLNCVSNVDCDGDGITKGCDENDLDIDNKNLKPVCVIPPDEDIDGVPNGEGDGYRDVACAGEELDRHLCDNCPTIPNPGQEDADGDGSGDACDEVDNNTCPDADGDGVCDPEDSCPSDYNVRLDADHDGLDDACDHENDVDRDGVTSEDGDCDDTNASIHPGMAENQEDSIDSNCNGESDEFPNEDNVLYAHPNIYSGGDGTFGHPFSLNQALEMAETGDVIRVYQGKMTINATLTINKKITLEGGIYCLKEENRIVYSQLAVDCLQRSQVKRYVAPGRNYVNPITSSLEQSKLTEIMNTGESDVLSITANARISNFKIVTSRCKNHCSAIFINSASPMIENNIILVTANTGFDGRDSDRDGLQDYQVTQGIVIRADSADAHPTIKDNELVVGQLNSVSGSASALPFDSIGIRAFKPPVGRKLKAVITNNLIGVGVSTNLGIALFFTGNDNYGKSEMTIISRNKIAVGAAYQSQGFIIYSMESLIDSNIIEVDGRNDGEYGILANGIEVNSFASIFTNLITVSLHNSPAEIQAIKITSSNGPVLIYENTIDVGKGKKTFGIYARPYKNIKTKGNIITSASAINSAEGAAIYETGSVDGLLDIRNNLVPRDFYFFGSDSRLDEIWNATAFAGQGNLFSMPNLTADYAPTSSSPAINAGYFIPLLTRDLIGKPKVNARDIGCYESDF